MKVLMLVSSPGQLPLDRSWFRHLNSLATSMPWLDTPVRDYATYGVVLFGVLLVVGWWLARRRSVPTRVAAALWAPLGMLLAIAVNQPIGRIVAEPRPYTALPHVVVLLARSSDFSFPSDHAVMAGAVTAGLLLVDRRLGLVALVAAVLLCLARVVAGVHYPVDVLAGLLVGALVTLVGYAVISPVLRRVVAWGLTTRLRPLLTTSAPAATP